VRFAARELWGEQASPRDTVYIDMWRRPWAGLIQAKSPWGAWQRCRACRETRVGQCLPSGWRLSLAGYVAGTDTSRGATAAEGC